MDDSAYRTMDDLAAMFGRSRDWVRRRCASGEFAHIRIGSVVLFSDDNIAEIIASHQRRPVIAPANPWGRRTRKRVS